MAKIILVVLLLVANVCYGQAVSYLGLCHKTWDCRKTLRTWNGMPNIVTGWLEGSFNRACPCGDVILKQSKPKVIRLHLANGPCLRNRRCGRHEVFYGYTVAGAARAIDRKDNRIFRRLDKVIERTKKRLESAKNLTCFISPVLESDFNSATRKALLDHVAGHFPSCRMVDNPLKKPCLPGYVCEKHGEAPKLTSNCIADLDGIDGANADLRAFKRASRGCFMQFYWEPWMNCIRGKFVDPLDRSCEYRRERFIIGGEKSCQLLSRQSLGTCSR